MALTVPDCEMTDPRHLHPRLEELQRLWESKRSAGRLPSRKDFDVLELQPWLGHISLVDVLNDGEDFRYRLHGTRNVETLGMDLTDRKVSELPEEMRRIVLREHLEVLERREPVHFRRERFNREQDHLRVLRLSLPLAADGQKIDMLLSCVYTEE